MKTISYNVYGFRGWDPAEESDDIALGQASVIDKMVDAFHHREPDLITLAEAWDRTSVDRMATALDMAVAYVPSPVAWPGAVISKVPIETAETVDDLLGGVPDDLLTRHAGRAVLNADTGPIVVYSLHLHPSDETIRRREIDLVSGLIEDDIAEGQPVLLQGDLNHPPGAREYDTWEQLGLTDTWATIGAGPGETKPPDAPEQRIDYIWVSDSLMSQLESAQTITDPPFGAGVDGSTIPDRFLSDHLPVTASFDR